MSTDIVTTEDTNNVTDVAKSVALEVSKQVATTVAGVVVASVLTSTAQRLVTKVRVARANAKYDKENTVAHAA